MNDAPWGLIRRLEARKDELEKELADARTEIEQFRADRARAVEALGDVGRAAEEVSGDLEDGINAELTAARAEVEQLAERAADEGLIRLAISDPGAFVKRQRFNDGDYETVPSWGARAVVVALREGRGNR
ncbi:hypothetical protein E1287_22520 [Actinomadura sp. KC06]|uniref:hypothetical protein n=1 Tax=Actinomadura sp. KC06 TaxID=2530369 RepID=UPI00104EF8D8|nr:hypothetical protein [Actinomadura sp. KC06]TDD32465.1 hypothetical protein E1287_22520 [Actinomadura sp. KC06]